MEADTDTLKTDFDRGGATSERMVSILTVLRGPEPGRVYPLESAQHVIGRSPEVAISIADPGLSREHASINRTAHGDFLGDLGSTNGTLVNGEKLSDHHALRDGDRIQLGRGTLLRYSRCDELEQVAAQAIYERTVRDDLTQLYSRRYIDDRLPAELAYAARHRVDLCVLLIDVDEFKHVNDTHGHLAGDRVLRSLARCFEGVVRSEDVLGRYGGEEFAVIALGNDHGAGLTLAERLRRAVEQLEIPWEDGALPITISVGMAHNFTTGQGTAEGLFAASDAALYEAKRKGRNRVESAGRDESSGSIDG